ncbi:MAG: DUF2510 domain-containing protein [Salinibacterium sp.]|nr:DUF2510 domain-containing protein [Salinibacterium sp.]
MSVATIAGWYPDPTNSAVAWRWWTGAAWTQDTTTRTDRRIKPADWGWDTDLPARIASTAAPASKTGNPWIWLLTFSAYIAGGIVAGVQVFVLPALGAVGSDLTLLVGAGSLLAAVIPLWILAELDGRSLRKRGFEAPSVLWMLLLPPVGYFIRRRVLVARAGGRAFGPELVFLIATAVLIAGAMLKFATLFTALQLLLLNGFLG